MPYSKDDIEIFFERTFNNIEDDYQKDQQKIARIDWRKLKDWFEGVLKHSIKNYNKKYSLNSEDVKIVVVLERPMINAERFKQSKNAARAFEATLIVLEMLDLKENYIIIDSKRWQHHFFGKNTMEIDLKDSSKKEGIKYLESFNGKYKSLCDLILNHGDADGLLIASYAVEKLI